MHPVQAGQLIRDPPLDCAARGGGRERGGALRGGAELGASVNDRDPGDVLERERPVHRRIPAPGDNHALAAEILASAHVILHRAGGLILAEAGNRWTVGAEGAGSGGDDDRLGAHRLALVGAHGEGAGLAGQVLDASAEQARGGERRDLMFKSRHQFAGGDRRMGGDVVDRLFRIERRALAAGLAKRVDQYGMQLQHPQLEHGEQAGRAGPDDGDVGLEALGHGSDVRHGAASGQAMLVGVMSRFEVPKR